MTATAIDSSVIVAALSSWHECHRAAHAAIQDLQRSGAAVLLPVSALVESYSVMTRLPHPYRVRPRDALESLRRSFQGRARLVGLDGDEAWELLERAAVTGTAGGAIYDAGIIACAVKAGASRILTFDERDFVRLAPPGIAIEAPA